MIIQIETFSRKKQRSIIIIILSRISDFIIKGYRLKFGIFNNRTIHFQISIDVLNHILSKATSGILTSLYGVFTLPTTPALFLRPQLKVFGPVLSERAGLRQHTSPRRQPLGPGLYPVEIRP